MKPIYIRVRKHIDPPGIVGTVLEVRVSNDIVSPTYERWATMSDYNNVAAKAQMLDRLLEMIEGAQSCEQTLTRVDEPLMKPLNRGFATGPGQVPPLQEISNELAGPHLGEHL